VQIDWTFRLFNPTHSAPTVAVGAIILDRDERVVLIQRGQPPQQGRWSIPGGKLLLGEAMADGVQREVMEETGLQVSVGPLIDTVERVTRNAEGEIQYHYIIVDFLCSRTGGTLSPNSDAASAEWASLDSLQNYDLIDGTEAVIRKALQMGTIS